MVARIGPVQSTSATGALNAGVYRNERVPAVNTNAIGVYATDTNLVTTLQGRLYRGRFLNAATEHLPALVLGADAAGALGIDRADGSAQVWLGNHWFAVVGILDPLTLAPELDRSALIGIPIAKRLLHYDGLPSRLYVRTDPGSVAAVQAVLADTANPAAPQNVTVTDPADALTARADATATFQSLYLALGAVALLVGGIGIANVMIIAVLERRGEIGLRRAIGGAPRHIGVQFVAEAALLALAGGTPGRWSARSRRPCTRQGVIGGGLHTPSVAGFASVHAGERRPLTATSLHHKHRTHPPGHEPVRTPSSITTSCPRSALPSPLRQRRSRSMCIAALDRRLSRGTPPTLPPPNIKRGTHSTHWVLSTGHMFRGGIRSPCPAATAESALEVSMPPRSP